MNGKILMEGFDRWWKLGYKKYLKIHLEPNLLVDETKICEQVISSSDRIFWNSKFEIEIEKKKD